MFSKKATKIDEIFTVNLMLCSKCQIYGKDFVNFSDLLRKYEFYQIDPAYHNCCYFYVYIELQQMAW